MWESRKTTLESSHVAPQFGFVRSVSYYEIGVCGTSRNAPNIIGPVPMSRIAESLLELREVYPIVVGQFGDRR